MKSHSDALYKQLFAHPEIVRELLVGFLATEWAPSLQVSAFERINASYISDGGKTRHDDMVWRVQIGGDWVYLYLLLEFQSRPDAWMALRMQVYVGLLYQDLLSQHRLTRGRKLPPVLPIVLYHGRPPWYAATDLADLMLPAPEGLEQFQPRQQYLLVEQHENFPNCRESNLLNILFQFLQAKTDAAMRAALALFIQRVAAPDMQPARDSLMQWVQSTLQHEFIESKVTLEEVSTMLFDQKFKKYEDLLEHEAIERGRLRGMREALQLALSDILVSGGKESDSQLPAFMSEKIDAADVSQLRKWIRSVARGSDPHHIFR